MVDNAERAVIGAILLDPGQNERIELHPEDFTDKHLGLALEVIRELRVEEVAIDQATVASKLALRGHPRGFVDHLSQLLFGDCVAACPNAENAASYARLVRDGSQRRQMALVLSDAAQRALKGEDPRAVTERVRKALRKRPSPGEPRLKLVVDEQALVLQANSPATVAAVLEDNHLGVIRIVDEAGEEPPEIRWNDMSGQVEVDGKAIDDDELSDIGIRIEQRFKGPRGGGMKQSMQDLHRGLRHVAKKNRYHPVREYLTACEEAWDGNDWTIPLLERGMRITPDKLQVTMLRHWLTGAVIRARWPGSKMDNMILLIGGQGVHKSQFLKMLADPWFIETDVDLSGKEAPAVLRMGWVNHLDEMEALLRARDQNAVKGFITRTEDSYRTPYSRTPITVPRSFVLAASTNEDAPLTDETGNRRTWPFQCNQPFDLDLVGDIRNQVWGEAAARVTKFLQRGIVKITGRGIAVASSRACAWWLTNDEEKELRERQVKFQKDHPWKDVVLRYSEGRAQVTMDEVLREAIGKPTGQWTSADARQVAVILRGAGWQHREPTRKRGAYWFLPLPQGAI